VRFAPILVLTLTLACASAQTADTLYFGTGRAGAAAISESEWQQFVREVIAPRMSGFTEWTARGVWKGTAEETHVVMFVGNGGDETAIRQIIDEYKRRFAQEAVLRVRSRVRATF